MAILLAAVAVWIAAGFGRAVLELRPFGLSQTDAGSLERFAYSGAIGLGVAGTGVLFIGLLGLLSFWPVTTWWAALGCAGYRGAAANTADIARAVRRLAGSRRKESRAGPLNPWHAAAAVVMLTVGAAALIACFKPPTTLEWDAISYHLADPRQFLMAHRISSLPTEHHSNFPLLIEMLFTVGLMYNGYALANMMHLAVTALTTVAIFATARRLRGGTAAWIASLLFVTTPVVFWESTVAYVENGLGMYVTLAVVSAVRACSHKPPNERLRNQWLLISCCCAGFGLGVKYLALIPFAMLAIYVLLSLKSLRPAVVYATIALAVASPWYIRSAVVTHNPVYPYFFKLFPNSRYWSTGRAAGYESEQARFGTPHSFKNPDVAARNLLQTPWDLITMPLSKPSTYSNAGEFSFLTLIGGLYFAFNAVTVLRRRMLREVATMLAFGLLQIAAWFFVAQVSRYLVSALPLLAISGGCGISAALVDVPLERRRPTTLIVPAVALALLAGQATILLYSLTLQAEPISTLNVFGVLEMLSTPDGVDRYLSRKVDTYPVDIWINRNAGAKDGVLLFDDTRGFYLERPYLWANEAHSSYIPYSRFADGKEMTDWMLSHHYRYAVIDMRWSPQANDAQHPDVELPNGPVGNEETAFQRWYLSAPLQPVGYAGYRWQGLLADAVKKGLWTDAGIAQRGIMVLRIGADQPGAAAGSAGDAGATP